MTRREKQDGFLVNPHKIRCLFSLFFELILL